MKNIILIINIILIFLLFTGYYSYADLDISAESAILMDASSGRILYSSNCNKKLPMASTTKIMTALLALKKSNLDEIIQIDKDCVGIEGSSIYLFEGEKVSIEDLLYGLMLRSGNDAAISIAKYIGGDVCNFVQMMNDEANRIGAYNTNFSNPNGLHDVEHYTTAYDLAIITREALKDETFKKIVKTKTWKANRVKNDYFYNKNKTLYQYPGGDGVKTGYTINAGRCLVSSATRNDTQLIAVVLNDRNWFNDCYKLLDYGFENYKKHLIFSKGQFIKNIRVNDGTKASVPIVTSKDFITLLKNEEKGKIKITIELPSSIDAPIKENDVVGKAMVYLDGELINTTDLIAKSNIPKENTFNKIIKNLRKN